MHIDHVAIVVEDLEAAVEAYEALGLVRYRIYEDIREQYPGEEDLHYRACAVMEHREADFHLWLMEPKGEGTALHRFLERHGPGLHHVGVHGDLDGIEERTEQAGIAWLRPVTDFGREGRRGLVDPRPLQGVLVEMSQPPT
jgi:catechol 2,3-dioxygenase-like lactoylglutathione lyase family enzyme